MIDSFTGATERHIEVCYPLSFPRYIPLWSQVALSWLLSSLNGSIACLAVSFSVQNRVHSGYSVNLRLSSHTYRAEHMLERIGSSEDAHGASIVHSVVIAGYSAYPSVRAR